jgi:SOS response regulatory protein OraA/RecX
MKNKIFYSVCYKDIQEVARQELQRKLTDEELLSVVDEISDRIDWYEPIANVLMKHFESAESQ